MASSRAATKGPKVAPVSARRPPVPVSAEKGVADRMYKNKWRAGECQQAKTSVTSSASSRQLGSQLAPAGRETRALPTRSRSLDISSESQNLVGSVDPSRLECGVGGVSEQSVPQSASVCSLRKRVEALESENAELKTELKRVRAMYDQLVAETPEERFDERRVLLLKGQVIQLERQVLLLSQSLNDRSTAMLEVDNLTEHIQHLLRSNAMGVKSVVDEMTRDPQKELLTCCREVHSRLSASISQKPSEHLAEVMSFSNPFARRDSQLTVLDVCMGGVGNLNLKHVARLESQLAHLYHKLEQLQPNLCSLSLGSREDCTKGKPLYSPPLGSGAGTCYSPARDLINTPCALPSVSLRCNTLLSDTLPLLRSCCCSLLSLSLLVPAAPWPPLQGEVEVSLTMSPEEVVKSLALTGPSKREVKEKLSSLWKCFQHALVLYQEKVNALEKETAYHSSVHKLEVEYTLHLLSALSDGYQSFQQSMAKDLSAPLTALLRDYSELRETASEETLSGFLTSFKNSSDCLQRVLAGLERQTDQHLGKETILELQRQFETAIQQL